MSFLNDIFGGGETQFNLEDFLKQIEAQKQADRFDKIGLFSSTTWDEDKGVNTHTVNPALQGGLDSMMERFGGGQFERRETPSQLKDLLGKRMDYQMDRLQPQAPLGQQGGMPGAIPGQLPPPPQQGMPPGAMPPSQPGGPGGMPPPQGPMGGQPPGDQAQLGEAGGMMGSMFGGGQGPNQGPPPQMGPPGPQEQMGPPDPAAGAPEWARKQRFGGGLLGAAESAIDQNRRNKEMPEDEQQSIFKALMGGF